MSALFFGATTVAVCALLLWSVTSSEKAMRRHKANSSEFDERQTAARGEAYRRAFHAVILFVFVECWVSDSRPWAEDSFVRAILCAYVGITVFTLEAIRRDAYFGLWKDPKTELFIGLALAVLGGLLAAFALHKGWVIRNGLLTRAGAWCVIWLFSLVILAAMANRFLRLRREEREDE